MKTVFQVIQAKNDNNGNPRRLVVVYNAENGEVVECHKQNSGSSPSNAEGQLHQVNVPQLLTVNVSPSEFNDFIRACPPYRITG